MSPQQKNLLAAAIGLFLAFMFAFSVQEDGAPKGPPRTLTYSQLVARVDAKSVETAVIYGDVVVGTLQDGARFRATVPWRSDIADRLVAAGAVVEIGTEDVSLARVLGQLFMSLLPILLLIGAWFYFFRNSRTGTGGFLSIGKSRARLLTPADGRVTFGDVAGVDEAKQELEELVDFLKDPGKFQRVGGTIPKGVLLVGPPGTGKTLLARAIAGEAGVPFYSISGSDFVEMFVGVGAARVRDMFQQAKKNAPCIVFVDEIDAVGRHRGVGLGGGSDEREQTLNQLLVEMDGFEPALGVILIAATNRPDVLDPALLRPGRFDRQVVVSNPDVVGREKILAVHMKKVPRAADVDAKILARGTPGFSGADLANLVNEAALAAARADRRVVTMQDFELAKDKVMMGAERRSMVMSPQERELTAYHEAGHALIAMKIAGNDPLHKVSIVPRGRALGVTIALPERDRLGYRRSELKARLAMLFGGRAAEALRFGADEVTTGASDDIRKATELARRMVTEWGMSERLGALRFVEADQDGFLGRGTARATAMSDETAAAIDQEQKRLIDEAEAAARHVLEMHRAELDLLAAALLEHETLSAAQVAELLRTGRLPPAESVPTRTSAPVTAVRPPAD